MRPVGSKYLLEEPLGRGATGTVWRGRQRETAGDEAAVAGSPGELVAIKVLKEELAHDPDVVMRFLRERSVLLRLTDDNIVRTRDLVVEGELLALVMDLVDGPDLHRYLRDNGPFSPIGAALVTAQVADALAAAHAKGVVHRDLKPANVLMAGGGQDGAPLRPLLTDFGIARLADSPGVTRAHEFVGTPSYIAPESAEGRPQTSAVDVYAAGILLYELVTGRPPFAGENTLQVLQRHLSEQPARIEGLPEPLWTVIDRCLRKSPDERPSAVNLAKALRTVVAGIGEHATREQADAAYGVAALLLPDSAPVKVAGPGGPDAQPTQAMPGGSHDPNAATSVLPSTGAGPGGAAGGAGAGAGGAGNGGLDGTRVMPAQPGPAEPAEPPPWADQMRAARDRNEQTQFQQLDPEQDPLYRAPQRQPQRRQPPPQPQPPQRRPQRRSTAAAAGHFGYADEQRYQQQPQPQPQQYQAPQPQRYHEPPPQRYQEPPRRREREPEREPRGRSRSANPMRIPGLGCLKGCLFMVVILVVIAFLLWNFTPLPEWVAEGQSFWEATKDWFSSVGEWLGLVEQAQDAVDNAPGN
ncbi:serine/threonine-protein kinase [Streptomyces harbinensis]|uniref:serine/threonine-protein kinase n=1 Tax=Streptomyces harbinensis TaxID=1176198 RepID=UPI00372301BE